ncbi:MAG: nucleotide exchange factor GrpE [Isosphaeraceae bacterium]
MSEAENPADVSPSEPDLNAPTRADLDPGPAVDVDSLEILVNPAGHEAAALDLAALGALPQGAAAASVGEAAGQSQVLLQAVKSLGERLDGRLDSLKQLFEREQRAEAARERVVDRLHAELQEYKQDLLLKVQRPIFIDLIQLHDDIGKMIEARSADDALAHPAGTFREVLESLQTAIEDILYRQGVEPFIREGTDFDPRRQRAVSTVPTDDPALGKTVAARLRKGFEAGDKVIRPEIVTVYAFRRAPALGSQQG